MQVAFRFTLLLLAVAGVACKNAAPSGKDIAVTPEELMNKTSSHIRESLDYASSNNGNIGDSIFLVNPALVREIYTGQDFKPVFSADATWKSTRDSLGNFITNAKTFGLFPEDYHAAFITEVLNKFRADTAGKSDSRDAALWSKLDLLLTDGFLRLVKDLKLGRLPNDSVSQRKDSVLANTFYTARLREFTTNNNLYAVMTALEPVHPGYRALRAAIPGFLAQAATRTFTPVPSMKENPAGFRTALQKRLFEGGYLSTDTVAADSATLASAIKAFQKDLGIAVDGQAGSGTLRMMNLSDKDRFISIAISLDRYKLLPEQMPERYIWVNLPAYYMELHHKDSVALYSKIVCGKPNTRTPLLTSSVSDLVTYPQWTIPASIIAKDILPAVKKDPGYLARKGYSLVTYDGDEVDPYEVDWKKYNKGIPYKVVQGSGDDNALGILKFNFPNKYAVYLHDTNQRYLFGQATRSLSHGCVRVQQWKELAYQIIRYDNGGEFTPDDETEFMPSPVEDSMTSWLERKEKHRIPVKKKVPVYIRYFTCEGKNGKLVFYDDMYGEDRMLKSKYYARK